MAVKQLLRSPRIEVGAIARNMALFVAFVNTAQSVQKIARSGHKTYNYNRFLTPGVLCILPSLNLDLEKALPNGICVLLTATEMSLPSK